MLYAIMDAETCHHMPSSARGPGALMSKDGRRWTSSSRGKIGREPILPWPFCSVQASRLDVASHPGEGGFSLLSLRIQCWSPLETPSGATPRNDVLPALWASFSPAKSTQKINHHSKQQPSCAIIRVYAFFNRIKPSSISSLDIQMANVLSVKRYLTVNLPEDRIGSAFLKADTPGLYYTPGPY